MLDLGDQKFMSGAGGDLHKDARSASARLYHSYLSSVADYEQALSSEMNMNLTT